MQIVSLVKNLIPRPHAYDKDKYFNVGFTWFSEGFLENRHNIQFRYTHNSEELACKNGKLNHETNSYEYAEPDGSTVHVVSKLKYDKYWDIRRLHAEEVKERDAREAMNSVIDQVIETSASPA